MRSEKMIRARLRRALGGPKVMEFILYKIRKHRDFYKTYNFKISKEEEEEVHFRKTGCIGHRWESRVVGGEGLPDARMTQPSKQKSL